MAMFFFAAGSFCTDARIYMQARKAKSNEQMKEREREGGYQDKSGSILNGTLTSS